MRTTLETLVVENEMRRSASLKSYANNSIVTNLYVSKARNFALKATFSRPDLPSFRGICPNQGWNMDGRSKAFEIRKHGRRPAGNPGLNRGYVIINLAEIKHVPESVRSRHKDVCTLVLCHVVVSDIYIVIRLK
jgi:hypothetical protein